MLALAWPHAGTAHYGQLHTTHRLYARHGPAPAHLVTSKGTDTPAAIDPATVNHDRRTWLAAAIARERQNFGRVVALREMKAELHKLERQAASAGWIRNDDRKVPTRRHQSGAA